MANWVFLRGLMREARHWGDFPRAFREALPDAEVFTPDLPGNGVFHAVSSPTRIAGMVQHCRESLKAQGIKPPYHLVALSMGGMAARAWAEHHPEEIASLVLISTSMRPYSPFYRRLRPGTYGALLQLAIHDGNLPQRERAILRMTSAHSAHTSAALLASWVSFATERPVSRLNALRQLVAAARFRAQPRSTAHPTLLLASRGDHLVHHSCSEQLARAWGAKLALHPVAGHDLPLDDAPWVIAQILDWSNVRRNAGHSVG